MRAQQRHCVPASPTSRDRISRALESHWATGTSLGVAHRRGKVHGSCSIDTYHLCWRVSITSSRDGGVVGVVWVQSTAGPLKLTVPPPLLVRACPFLFSHSIQSNSGSVASSLKHVEPKESASVVQAKVLLGVTGKHELNHVEAPTAGLTQAQKDAFVNKVKDEE